MLERLPLITELPGGYYAMGVERDGEIIGGVLYSSYAPVPGGGDVQMWAVGHGWLSRRIVRVFLGYAFERLNCHRITVGIAKGNGASRRLVEKLGFRMEGKLRRGFDTRRDLLVYGLLKDDAARWLRPAGTGRGKI